MKKLVISDPRIMGGKPVIIGTRIPLSLILNLILKEGYTKDNIHDFYPQLPVKTIESIVDEVIVNTEQKCYAA